MRHLRDNVGAMGGFRRPRQISAPPPASGDPSGLVATALAPLEVRLSWTHASAPGDTRYEIERGNGAGGWYRVGTSYSDCHEFTDWGRAQNTAYTYRVRAVNSGGTSPYTNQATATTMNEDGAGEFVGPFPSWRNLKTFYGAAGNGIADDTDNWQAALNDLVNGVYKVLWVPAGTYKLTNTISTTRTGANDHGNGMAIIGEHPATTTLVWDATAPLGEPMFLWDAWYSRISRLTFNGNNRTLAGLLYGGQFSTYNETSDCVFQDCQHGLLLGDGTALGQAENYVKRCTFLRCTTAGVWPNGANSMDIWCWHCRFQDCGRAVTGGYGNLSAWHCYFTGSTVGDFVGQNLLPCQAYNNVSIGSNTFCNWVQVDFGGSPDSCCGNRVIMTTAFPAGPALRFSEGGPFFCMDNILQARSGQTSPLVELDDGPTLIAGNLYTIANAAPSAFSLTRRLDEQQISAASVDPTPPTLPGTPPNLGRAIFEVASGASAATIQAAINSAHAAGNKAVVHLPVGIYSISSTLTVPANSTIQIIGDIASDYGTELEWTGAAGQPLLHFTGPSKASVQNLKIHANDGIGVLIDGADQVGGHVYTEQVVLQGIGSSLSGCWVNGVEQTDVTLTCVQGGDCGGWIYRTGGALQGAGGRAPNHVAVFAGGTSYAERQYRVDNGGELAIRGVYHEATGPTPQAVIMDAPGRLAIDATRFSQKTVVGTGGIEVRNGFQGDLLCVASLFQLVNSSETPTFRVSGSGTGMRVVVCMNEILHLNTTDDADDIWFNTTSPAATAEFFGNYAWQEYIGHPTNLANRGGVTDDVLRSLFNILRRCSHRLPGTTPAGVTDVRLAKVIFHGFAPSRLMVVGT